MSLKRFCRVSLLVAGFLGAATLAACGSSGAAGSTTSQVSSPSPPTVVAPSGGGSHVGARPATVAVITIKNFGYRVPGHVRPGEKVKVTNSDQVAHTVTADQSDSLFNVTVAPGSSATFTAPGRPGSYKFHCTYHANMHGTLVVT